MNILFFCFWILLFSPVKAMEDSVAEFIDQKFENINKTFFSSEQVSLAKKMCYLYEFDTLDKQILHSLSQTNSTQTMDYMHKSVSLRCKAYTAFYDLIGKKYFSNEWRYQNPYDYFFRLELLRVHSLRKIDYRIWNDHKAEAAQELFKAYQEAVQCDQIKQEQIKKNFQQNLYWENFSPWIHDNYGKKSGYKGIPEDIIPFLYTDILKEISRS